MWPKKTPSETPPATSYPIKTCTCTIFLKIGSYFRSQGRFRPRAYFLLGPRSFPERMLYGYPDPQHRLQQKCVLHLEIAMEAWLSHPFCASFLTRRILRCAFAASPPLPRAFPSHPCHFLVVFDFLSWGLHRFNHDNYFAILLSS